MTAEAAAAIVLAGGKSRRMRSEKALLPINGRFLIERIIDQLRPHFRDIIISTSSRDKFAFLRLPVCVDETPGQGPLMAILSALRMSGHDSHFIMACDIPVIRAQFLQRLIALGRNHDIVVPRYRDGKFEPLFATYRRAIIPTIERLLQRGERRIASLFELCDTKYVPMDGQKWFHNLNTLEEYHDYLRRETAKQLRDR